MIGQDFNMFPSRNGTRICISLELPLAIGRLECLLERGEAKNLSCPHMLETASIFPVLYHVGYHVSRRREYQDQQRARSSGLFRQSARLGYVSHAPRTCREKFRSATHAAVSAVA